jgi:hypothetical protein
MPLSIAEGQELANKIEDWVKASGGKSPSADLQSFIDDLRGARNVNVWAGVDYQRMLPLRYEKQTLVSLLTVVRNVLVFAPILLTWWALRDASHQFSEYIAGREDLQVNFLKFWQDMNGLSSFPNVAGIDALLLAIIIGLTLLIGVIETTTQRPEKLRRQHESLMISLEKSLSGYRYLSISDINLALQGTLSSLLNSSQRIEQGSITFADSTKEAFEALNGIRKISDEDFRPVLSALAETLAMLRQASEGHLTLIDTVVTAKRELESQLSTTRSGFSEIIDKVDERSADILSRIEKSLTDAVNSLAATAKDVSTRLAIQTSSELAQVATQITEANGVLRAGFGSAGDRLVEGAAAFEKNVRLLESLLISVRRAVNSGAQEAIGSVRGDSTSLDRSTANWDERGDHNEGTHR